VNKAFTALELSFDAPNLIFFYLCAENKPAMSLLKQNPEKRHKQIKNFNDSP
jgi:hypothetical protein